MTTTQSTWTHRLGETITVDGESITMPDSYSLRIDEEREVAPGVFLSVIVEAIVGQQDDCLGGGWYFDANGCATNADVAFGQFGTGYATAADAMGVADHVITDGIANFAGAF